MKPNKYEKLDLMIINKLGHKPLYFSWFFYGEIERECKRIVEEDSSCRPAFRVLDLRLQALRKKGIIRCTTKGWVLV